MNNKALRGIALILFGILLCAGESGINSTVLYRFGEFPFSAIGFLLGAVGLRMVFRSCRDQQKEISDRGSGEAPPAEKEDA